MSSPRFLIWSVCFGEHYRGLARLWLDSLVRTGQWRHDIVLLGDSGIHELSHPQLRTFDVVADLARRFSLPHEQWDRWVTHNWKPAIQFYADLDQYEYVLYCDVDVLVNSDRLESILAAKAATGVITVQQDIVTVSLDRVFTGRDTLTPEEKKRWADYAICAGIVGVPINELGRQFFADWLATYASINQFRGSDQAKLIPLLLRHYQGRWEYLGDTAVVRQPGPRIETLLHFSNQHALMRDYYGSVLRLREPHAWAQRVFLLRRRFIWRPFNVAIHATGTFLWRFAAMRKIGQALWTRPAARRIGVWLWD